MVSFSTLSSHSLDLGSVPFVLYLLDSSLSTDSAIMNIMSAIMNSSVSAFGPAHINHWWVLSWSISASLLLSAYWPCNIFWLHLLLITCSPSFLLLVLQILQVLLVVFHSFQLVLVLAQSQIFDFYSKQSVLFWFFHV